ncbi:MAG TPA: DUF5131 family protein [Candidatus Bathyarchaeia archaeon]|nr:DUF5131 family protein [Candidatus Bathyarchaeia archaeon]
MNRTKIEYLNYTLNVIVGCSGEGCAVRKKCWARAQAKRRKGKCKDDRCYRFVPHDHPERLEEPLHVKKPSRIGLNFSGETFDRAFKDRSYVWFGMCGMMRRAAWHTFVVLTKQPQNIPEDENFPLPPNLWLGVSVNCKKDLWRIDKLREINVAVKFVCFEPLYEDLCPVDLSGIDWIIIGGQTRPKKLPNPRWVSKLVVKARDFGVPVFAKDNLEEMYWRYPSSRPQEFPESKTLREVC